MEVRCGNLFFTSKFDSGNLARVEKVVKEDGDDDGRFWTFTNIGSIKLLKENIKHYLHPMHNVCLFFLLIIFFIINIQVLCRYLYDKLFLGFVSFTISWMMTT